MRDQSLPTDSSSVKPPLSNSQLYFFHVLGKHPIRRNHEDAAWEILRFAWSKPGLLDVHLRAFAVHYLAPLIDEGENPSREHEQWEYHLDLMARDISEQPKPLAHVWYGDELTGGAACQSICQLREETIHFDWQTFVRGFHYGNPDQRYVTRTANTYRRVFLCLLDQFLLAGCLHMNLSARKLAEMAGVHKDTANKILKALRKSKILTQIKCHATESWDDILCHRLHPSRFHNLLISLPYLTTRTGCPLPNTLTGVRDGGSTKPVLFVEDTYAQIMREQESPGGIAGVGLAQGLALAVLHETGGVRSAKDLGDKVGLTTSTAGGSLRGIRGMGWITHVKGKGWVKTEIFPKTIKGIGEALRSLPRVRAAHSCHVKRLALHIQQAIDYKTRAPKYIQMRAPMVPYRRAA